MGLWIWVDVLVFGAPHLFQCFGGGWEAGWCQLGVYLAGDVEGGLGPDGICMGFL